VSVSAPRMPDIRAAPNYPKTTPPLFARNFYTRVTEAQRVP
jgi:hypothetical protein